MSPKLWRFSYRSASKIFLLQFWPVLRQILPIGTQIIVIYAIKSTGGISSFQNRIYRVSCSRRKRRNWSVSRGILRNTNLPRVETSLALGHTAFSHSLYSVTWITLRCVGDSYLLFLVLVMPWPCCQTFKLLQFSSYWLATGFRQSVFMIMHPWILLTLEDQIHFRHSTPR